MNLCAILKKNKELIVFLGTTAAVYLAFRYLLPLVVPFLIAYLAALVLRPVVCFMHKWLKIPLVIGSGFSVILLAGILFTGLFFLLKALITQLLLFVQGLPAWIEQLMGRLDFLCRCCDEWFGLTKGTVRLAAEDGIRSITGSVTESLGTELTRYSFTAVTAVGAVGAFVFLLFVSMVLITKELCEYREGKRKSSFYPWVSHISKHLSAAGLKYLKVQGILIASVAAICSIGLFIAGNPYALLIGMGIAVLDAFPVLGSGLVLVPWIVISAFSGNYFQMIVLAVVYLLCQLVRQYFEPKLLGNTMGIRSVYTLIAMYAGVKLFGVAGFLLGPIGLIIIKTISEGILDQIKQS